MQISTSELNLTTQIITFNKSAKLAKQMRLVVTDFPSDSINKQQLIFDRNPDKHDLVYIGVKGIPDLLCFVATEYQGLSRGAINATELAYVTYNESVINAVENWINASNLFFFDHNEILFRTEVWEITKTCPIECLKTLSNQELNFVMKACLMLINPHPVKRKYRGKTAYELDVVPNSTYKPLPKPKFIGKASEGDLIDASYYKVAKALKRVLLGFVDEFQLFNLNDSIHHTFVGIHDDFDLPGICKNPDFYSLKEIREALLNIKAIHLHLRFCENSSVIKRLTLAIEALSEFV